MNSYKAGFLGLIGQPNAGKSSLMNHLIEEKISIVTSKPQTTRRRIHGLWSTPQGQIVFVDAPGVVKAEKGLNAFLTKEAESVMDESDALCAVVSVDESKSEDAQQIIDMVSASGKPWLALITKVDLPEKEHRILILKNMIEKKGGKAFPFTIKNKEFDREALMLEILKLLPDSKKPLFDEDIYTPDNIRDLAAEIVREKCFLNLHHEIPYSIAVKILKWDETSKSIPHVSMEILVAKEAHKGMVIGKQGSVLKKIGMESRQEIENLTGEKIFLDIKVSYKENWFNKEALMKELGYVTRK